MVAAQIASAFFVLFLGFEIVPGKTGRRIKTDLKVYLAHQ
jgi:hypothetical protein